MFRGTEKSKARELLNGLLLRRTGGEILEEGDSIEE